MTRQPPHITIYHRTIDNVTNQEVDGYKLLNSKSNFHFGTISGIDGGESPYVIELDIWNNEPAFYGGMYTMDVTDAINCRFNAWGNNKLNSAASIRSPLDNKSFIMSRCVTRDFPSFKFISGNNGLTPDNLQGSILNSYGVLSGQQGGDHMKIQTKIKIPPNTSSSLKSFVLEFSYDYV